MDNYITVKNLCKNYYLFKSDFRIIPWLFTKRGNFGEKDVLKNVSLTVKKGEMVGVIGKNGAGKSTLMKIIAGITFPSSGEVCVKGKVGSFINLNAGFNPDYTGRKNIYYKGMLTGMTEKEIDSIIDDIIDFVELGPYFDMPVRTYSSGMSARLGFALAVFSAPDILIIDEVFAVGDKAFQEKSRAKTIELFNSGKSILFSSHSDTLIRKFCSRVIYIKDGQVAFDGDVEEGLELYNKEIRGNKK